MMASATARTSTRPTSMPWTSPTESGQRELRRPQLRQLVSTEQRHLRAYDEALGLWRGEPLSDFVTEQWATAEAARLTELRLAALIERAQVALALGLHLEVVGDLEPLVSADPTMESLAGLLMLALYRSGRQADALEVYTRTRTVLDETLGLEPSVSLRSLHERVLRQDQSLGGGSDVSAASAVAAVRSRGAEDGAATTNLPTVVRALIGRDEQLDSLSAMLGGVRLLSLIGPGGAGKTSLALATAVRASHGYADGAFGVRLASVENGDQVPLAVADALGVPLDGSGAERDVRQRLTSFLARRQMLLLVDNCEHVVDAAASLIDDILGQCPNVTVLATSREALAVPDEVQVTVAPLATPPEDTPSSQVLELPGRTAVRRAGTSRATRTGLRQRGPVGGRADQPRARRHPAGPGACGRPGRVDVTWGDRGQARATLLVPDVWCPDRRSPAADAAGNSGLELCAAERGRAPGVQPAIGLQGRLVVDGRRSRRRR